MNKYTCFFVGILFSTITFASNAGAELAQLLEKTHTMQADFEQFIISASGKELGEHTAGKIAIERPGKFRWETSHPTHQLIVANNDYIWNYDADLAQATKGKIDYAQAGNPAMLLSGSSETLRQSFYIFKIAKPGVGIWFELKPKVKNNLYQWIKLHLIEEHLDAIYIMNNLDQNSEIRFENIIINADLPAGIFKFSPPKGTDVIVGL